MRRAKSCKGGLWQVWGCGGVGVWECGGGGVGGAGRGGARWSCGWDEQCGWVGSC